jgi:hypothetical protein
VRIGRDLLTAAVNFAQASRRLVGFLPPADAYDDVTAQAATAMGYSFLASACYREFPNLIFTDQRGLVHVPWSQTAWNVVNHPSGDVGHRSTWQAGSQSCASAPLA